MGYLFSALIKKMIPPLVSGLNLSLVTVSMDLHFILKGGEDFLGVSHKYSRKHEGFDSFFFFFGPLGTW